MADKPNQTILVIDDDEDIVKTIKGNLELDGYTVLFAHEGREGIDLARERRPHLVVLDLNLPDIDGIKACQFIREQIWRDSGLYKHSRTVDVHVQRLRKKLENNPNTPRFIVTVAGVGYKYMADGAEEI